MNYQVDGLNKLAQQLHSFQMNAGFTDSSVSQRLLLVVTELGELFEAFRKDNYTNLRLYNGSLTYWSQIKTGENSETLAFKEAFERHIKDTVEDEAADTFIRFVAWCGEHNIDLEKHIQLKMRYNALRGYKFGNKKF